MGYDLAKGRLRLAFTHIFLPHPRLVMSPWPISQDWDCHLAFFRKKFNRSPCHRKRRPFLHLFPEEELRTSRVGKGVCFQRIPSLVWPEEKNDLAGE